MLQGAASDAVKQWKYEPFTCEGKPVQARTKVTMNL
jgi:TonB-like protein